MKWCCIYSNKCSFINNSTCCITISISNKLIILSCYFFIFNIENIRVPIGKLDITLYRDDLAKANMDAKVTGSEINFSLEGKDVILCDDVLFTGRTVRAGIEAIFKLGRPSTIQLAVLIDRGHRELPMRADYVGKNVPTALGEEVQVCLDASKGVKAVILNKRS